MTPDNPHVLGDKDRFLVDKAEIALRKGARLVSWWRAKEAAGDLNTFVRTPKEMPSVKISCFFDRIDSPFPAFPEWVLMWWSTRIIAPEFIRI